MKDQPLNLLSQARAGTGNRVTPPVIPVSALLRGQQCAQLEHRGEYYQLRITRTGKLILTK